MKNRITWATPESAPVVQAFGTLESLRLGLSDSVRLGSVSALNRILAQTVATRDLYGKAHRHVSGWASYELHLLFDKYYWEQLELLDELAERVQTLSSVAFALAHDVFGETRIARAPPAKRASPIS